LNLQIARENALHFNDIINFEDESNDADRGKKFLRFVKYIDKHYKYATQGFSFILNFKI